MSIDAATLAAILGGALSICGSLIYVGRKLERVDQRLSRLEADISETKAARLIERVTVLETQVADLRAEV